MRWPDRHRRAVPAALRPGHYANVISIDERTGLALSTDGVGTKLIVAEQLGRFDTVGIDCVAMNVNDVVCVGAKPIAMLDYLAGRGGRSGGESRSARAPPEPNRPASRYPAASWRSSGRCCRGFDLAAPASASSRSTRSSPAPRSQPGDAVIGLPSSGCTRTATRWRAGAHGHRLDDERLGRPLGEVLLEPTEIYVEPMLELLRSEVEVHGLAHITSGGLGNLLRLAAEVGYEIDAPLPVPPIFELIRERGGVADEEMYEVFNMGCGFCGVVPAADEAAALDLLRAPLPRRRSGSARRPRARAPSTAASGPHRGGDRRRRMPSTECPITSASDGPASTSSQMIGTVLSGRYKLEAKLGSGGMSTVYLARDTTLDRPVAVKVMHREMSEQADQLERFRQEARAVAKLSHPNVVAVIDAGEDGGHPYIVFEYVEGETLKQRIARRRRARHPGGARLHDRDRPRPHRRPRAQDGPPRHQAAERPDRRRGPGQADRLRDLPPARAGRDDGHRPGARDNRLRRPRAGDGPRRSTRAPTSTRSASSSTRC